jgi:hypothetical protein
LVFRIGFGGFTDTQGHVVDAVRSNATDKHETLPIPPIAGADFDRRRRAGDETSPL